MIYDCFLFFNEFDILDIRLNELNEVVDKFVLVESTTTHSGKKKQLYFAKNKKKFKKFENKIIHVIVNDTPKVRLSWIINDFNFSQMVRGLGKCEAKDIIIFGDVDEIPRASKIKDWIDGKNTLKVFEQTLSFYFLNNVEYANDLWLGTHMTTFEHLKNFKSLWIAKFSEPDIVIKNGGWHFSYIADIKNIQKKISNSTHQELNNDKYNSPESIKKAILEQRDVFGLGYKFKRSSLSLMPNYVQINKKKFSKILLVREGQNVKFITELNILFLNVKNLLRVNLVRRIKYLFRNTK